MADDETPFAIGAIYGVRSWRIGPLGILRSVVYKSDWKPGVNEAVCRGFRRDRLDGRPIESASHLKACHCGFYAFTEGSSDYRGVTRVTGVVKMYGLVVPGSHGSRAQRAEIVALHIRRDGDDAEPPTDGRVDHMRRSGFFNDVKPVTRLQEWALRNNYRGVPFFDSFEEMVAAFPVNPTPKETP